ncbi:MAG: hypothetical protein NT154_16690, partial [Verrucomicrobia bacterium]|nr:hypothetical protein [Verrucomicrobiota bacterium]
HQGNYSRQFHSGWTGTVTPNAPGYEFTPPFRCYNCITSDWAAQDFAGYTPKGQQYPDLTSNALEVFADTPSILADDFLCRLPGPISGVTLWGSWTNNVVDTNAIFRLALWSNGPTSNNLPSQPDQALYAEFFYPPTWVADTAVRYSCRPEPVTNGKAFFYPDRNLVSTNRNPQLWRYDFYPPITDPYSGPRWRQDGTHVHPKVYWLSANVINDTNNFRFGWRTSPRHLGTNAVFGHTTSLGDWQALRAPPNQQRLDLAFELRTFPTVSCGKTLKSPTGTNADCLEIVLEGIQEIVRHADDLPPWPNFTITYTNGNTVLDWCGKVLTNGAATQIAFEIPGTKFTILSMGWLAGGRVVGTPHQANFLLPHGGGPGLIYNDLASSLVYLQGGFAEYHIEAVPLAHLNPLGVRTNSLMTTFALPAAPLPVPPSQTGTFSLPEAPANAQYLVLVLNLGADAINPATVDYLQFPLDTALRPTVESIDSTDTSVTLIWSTLPGRTYRVQHADVLSGTMTPEWVDEPGDVYTEGYNVSKQVPIGDAQRFYRVILLP